METMSDWFFPVMGLSGGLAIFLLGMDRTVSGLKGLAGNRLRWIDAHLTGNRWYGAATGAGITAIIQSSSVTTVVVVGLVSAQAMTLLMSDGVIFGANVGTTITAQIIAFKVTRYALVVVAMGFAIDFFAKTATGLISLELRLHCASHPLTTSLARSHGLTRSSTPRISSSSSGSPRGSPGRPPLSSGSAQG